MQTIYNNQIYFKLFFKNNTQFFNVKRCVFAFNFKGI